MNGLYPAGAAESGPTALEVAGLGKHYRRGWALKDCSFRLPAGRICALVGPNGAGKSTLMSIVSGLLTPTEGMAEVLGRPLGEAADRGRIGFVAQDKPLYPGFTVAETLRLGRELNPSWHQAKAEEVVAQGDIPLSARIGSLSGGQRTRVTLALALGRLPELLILDEPMSDLDPLARHQLMGVLMAEAAERGITVLMSSHVIAELEDSCDYLVLLSGGGVLLAGDIDEIVEGHQLLIGDDGSQPRTPPRWSRYVAPAARSPHSSDPTAPPRTAGRPANPPWRKSCWLTCAPPASPPCSPPRPGPPIGRWRHDHRGHDPPRPHRPVRAARHLVVDVASAACDHPALAGRRGGRRGGLPDPARRHGRVHRQQPHRGLRDDHHGPGLPGEGIQHAVDTFRSRYAEILHGVGALLLMLPVAVGVFVAGPLLSKEYESGTWRLVLGQSVSRTRWLVAKLATSGAVAVAGSLALMGLFHWMWLPSANFVSGVAWCSSTFIVSGGPLLAATVLLALAIGATVGSLTRRVVPAMAITFGAVVVTQYVLASVRPYLVPYQTRFVSNSELPNDVWSFDRGFVTADGRHLSYEAADTVTGAREYTDLHTAADYWPLQGVESGICLVLAAALVGFLFWRARRSD